VNTKAYLINKLKIHIEGWSGNPTYYSGFNDFKALTFTHIKQDKLNARAMTCVFIGYLEGVKGYKLFKMEP